MKFENIEGEWELVEKNEDPEEGPAYLVFYRIEQPAALLEKLEAIFKDDNSNSQPSEK